LKKNEIQDIDLDAQPEQPAQNTVMMTKEKYLELELTKLKE
jgi:hypothetical protein